MAKRPAQHLGELLKRHGYSDEQASKFARETIEAALNIEREAKDAQRVAEGKTQRAIYATDLGKECDLQFTLGFSDLIPEPFSLDSLINFGVGSSVENWLADTLLASGAGIVREASAVTEVSLDCGECSTAFSEQARGRIDILATLKDEDGATTVMEVKSINSRAMGMMLKFGERGKAAHRLQLQYYLRALNRGEVQGGQVQDGGFQMSGEDIIVQADAEQGLLVYVVKDPTKGEPNIHAYWVERDDAAIESRLRELAALKHRYEFHGVLGNPAAEAVKSITKGGKQWWGCTYCSHRMSCPAWPDTGMSASSITRGVKDGA